MYLDLRGYRLEIREEDAQWLAIILVRRMLNEFQRANGTCEMIVKV
jgi:hypothetical protein